MAAAPFEVALGSMTFRGLQWNESGDGAPVLCLHGFPQHSSSWTGVAERLAALGRWVVAIDQRGYSPGARPSALAAYALPHLVADAAGMISALGGPAHLVGHDWGGVVGWQVAARHPELVQSWTAVSTAHPLALNQVLASDPAQRDRFGYIRVFRERGEELLLADDARRLRALYGTAVAPEQVEAEVAAFREPGALTAALAWYRAMSSSDAVDLPRVTVSTAYVWGSTDPAFGPEAAAATGAYVDGPYRFVALHGAGHWLPDEAPDSVADVIADLLAATETLG